MNNNNNNNNNNYQPYDRNIYLEIFGRLHHKDGPAPYAGWNADNLYYGTYIEQFMEDMRQLANMDRAGFERILASVSERWRGPSDIKTRMTELNRSLQVQLQPQQKAQPGGKRYSKKIRKSIKKSVIKRQMSKKQK